MSRDIITKPGLVGDMDEDWYHSDPVPEAEGGSLSVSGAKKLLAPSCPAIYRWEADHPSPPTPQMEQGTVIHAILLGTPQPAEVLDFPDFTARKARDARDAARDAGRIPMTIAKFAECEAIAQAVLGDDECAGLLAEGDSEVSGFWVDQEFGIWCRMRMDKLTYFGETPTIVDVKSCRDSSPAEFARSIAEYRYDMQDVNYRQGLAAVLGMDDWQDIDFVFLAVPTSEPYLPMTYRLEDDRDIENALASNRMAREIWRDCTDGNVWPKWSRDITPLSLPGYARKRIEESIHEYYD